MDKEERAKYDCIKDKENLEKAQKSGKSFLYLSQYTRKNIWTTIAVSAIEVTIGVLVLMSIFTSTADQSYKDNQMLIKQLNQYIKSDFKQMNCLEKSSYIEKYTTDKTIYHDVTMQEWLVSNFEDSNCLQKQH
jgi:hypothetical protein